MNHSKRNVAIAVVLLVILLLIPFWPKLKSAVHPAGGSDTGPMVSCTMEITCPQVLDYMDELKPETAAAIPKKGIFLPKTELEVPEGSSLLDVLQLVGQQQKLSVEVSGSPAYVVGIGGLRAGDATDMAGWTYTVNGESIMVGCSEQKVEEGDQIAWTYLCTWE
ncbi:MAG: DUF4430 domain-containing protein [Evtepia sp.]|uniref:DUF4430 domain-containing protein n=1 Tax=Evtepia sp. TaxID=2773933 RepID=UPI002A75DD2F|nr:DUF4430 domain-containing protein [Evtepia sp.]MDY3014956.1 DUF4430 domain-containing protein [Evtepia sp.]